MTNLALVSELTCVSGYQRKLLLAIASRLDFECSSVVSEEALLVESTFEEATFRRLSGELAAAGWIECRAGKYRLSSKVYLELSPQRQVTLAQPDAYAAPFRHSSRWYICDRVGGSIVGIGEAESGAWADALSAMARKAAEVSAHVSSRA